MWVIVPTEDKENMTAPQALDKWEENNQIFDVSTTRQKLRGWDRKPVLAHAPRLQGQKVWKRINAGSRSDVEEHDQGQTELLREGEGSRKKLRPIGAKENIGAARWNKASSNDTKSALSPHKGASSKGILTPNASKHNFHNAQSPTKCISSPTKVDADDKLNFVPRKRTNNNHVITPKKKSGRNATDKKMRRQSRAELHVDNHSQNARPRRSLRKSGQFKDIDSGQAMPKVSPLKVSTPRFEPKLDTHKHQSLSKPAFEVWSTLRTRQTPSKPAKSRCSASPTKLQPSDEEVVEALTGTLPKNTADIDALLGSPSAAPPTMIVESLPVPEKSPATVLAMSEKHTCDDPALLMEHEQDLPENSSNMQVNDDFAIASTQSPDAKDERLELTEDIETNTRQDKLNSEARSTSPHDVFNIDMVQTALEPGQPLMVDVSVAFAGSHLPSRTEHESREETPQDMDTYENPTQAHVDSEHQVDERSQSVSKYSESTSSPLRSDLMSDTLEVATSNDLCRPSNPLNCMTMVNDKPTERPSETEVAQEGAEVGPALEVTSETPDHDDTRMLRNFLTRVQANKVAKNAPKRKRSLPHSPLQLPLGNLADAMSPSPQQNKGSNDELAASPAKRERKTAGLACDEPQSIRRSARTRLPVKAHPPPSAISFLPVRRVLGDQDTTVSLRRTEEKDLAALTRVNTRKNKGASLPAPVVLAKKAEEKDDPVLRQRLLKELLDERPETGKRRTGDKARKALNVGWAEELARYQDLTAVGTTTTLAKILNVCDDGEAREAAAQTKARYGVRVRSKVALGMGINGTPAPKRKMKSHT